MSGFIALHREAFDHPVLRDGDRFRAWFWMVSNACWKQSRVEVGGAIITLERGQLCYSIRYLAEAWRWPKSNVDRFLKRLEAESMLTLTRSKSGTASGTAQIIVTICNYDKYQDVGNQTGTASGTEVGQQRDSSGTNKNKGNKGTIEEEPNGSPSTPKAPKPKSKPKMSDLASLDLPDWLPVEAWNGFLEMRQDKGAVPTVHAAKLIIAKLDQWRADGQPPGKVLDQSTVNNWTDIYRLKDNQHGNRNQNDGRSASGNRGPRIRTDGFTDAINAELARTGSFGPSEAAGRYDDDPASGTGQRPLADQRSVR